MGSKIKIVMLRMRGITYTATSVGLAILLITLCFIMFRPKEDAAAVSTNVISHVPGAYNAALTLGSENVNAEVTVGADRINSIDLVLLSEAVTTMYPLMQPTLDDLVSQTVSTQSTENLTYPSASHYTSTAFLNAISTALGKAKIDQQVEK